MLTGPFRAIVSSCGLPAEGLGIDVAIAVNAALGVVAVAVPDVGKDADVVAVPATQPELLKSKAKTAIDAQRATFTRRGPSPSLT